MFIHALQRLFKYDPASRLMNAKSELNRIEQDLQTMAQMLNHATDSFHHAAASATAHRAYPLDRQRQLRVRIEALTERLAVREHITG